MRVSVRLSLTGLHFCRILISAGRLRMSRRCDGPTGRIVFRGAWVLLLFSILLGCHFMASRSALRAKRRSGARQRAERALRCLMAWHSLCERQLPRGVLVKLPFFLSFFPLAGRVPRFAVSIAILGRREHMPLAALFCSSAVCLRASTASFPLPGSLHGAGSLGNFGGNGWPQCMHPNPRFKPTKISSFLGGLLWPRTPFHCARI